MSRPYTRGPKPRRFRSRPTPKARPTPIAHDDFTAEDPPDFTHVCPLHGDHTICWDCATPYERVYLQDRAYRRLEWRETGR